MVTIRHDLSARDARLKIMAIVYGLFLQVVC